MIDVFEYALYLEGVFPDYHLEHVFSFKSPGQNLGIINTVVVYNHILIHTMVVVVSKLYP